MRRCVFFRIVQEEKCGQTCSFSTDIANHPDSMLAALLRHSESMPSRMVDGGIFINRDGSIFKHVARYVRKPGQYSNRAPIDQCEELKAEAEFYMLPQLVIMTTSEFQKGIERRTKDALKESMQNFLLNSCCVKCNCFLHLADDEPCLFHSGEYRIHHGWDYCGSIKKATRGCRNDIHDFKIQPSRVKDFLLKL